VERREERVAGLHRRPHHHDLVLEDRRRGAPVQDADVGDGRKRVGRRGEVDQQAPVAFDGDATVIVQRSAEAVGGHPQQLVPAEALGHRHPEALEHLPAGVHERRESTDGPVGIEAQVHEAEAGRGHLEIGERRTVFGEDDALLLHVEETAGPHHVAGGGGGERELLVLRGVAVEEEDVEGNHRGAGRRELPEELGVDRTRPRPAVLDGEERLVVDGDDHDRRELLTLAAGEEVDVQQLAVEGLEPAECLHHPADRGDEQAQRHRPPAA